MAVESTNHVQTLLPRRCRSRVLARPGRRIWSFIAMPLVQGVADEVLVAFAVLVSTVAAVVVRLCKRSPEPVAATVDEVYALDRASLDNCAICLDAVAFPISTNCGHTFCGSCMVAYFDHSQGAQGLVTCPLCRREITLLERRGWTADEARSAEGTQRQEELNACVRCNVPFGIEMTPQCVAACVECHTCMETWSHVCHTSEYASLHCNTFRSTHCCR